MFDKMLYTIDFNKECDLGLGHQFYSDDKLSLFEMFERLDSHRNATQRIHKVFDQDKDGFLTMKDVGELLEINHLQV